MINTLNAFFPENTHTNRDQWKIRQRKIFNSRRMSINLFNNYDGQDFMTALLRCQLPIIYSAN